MRIASAILSGTSIVLGAWLISAMGMPQNNQRIRVTPNEADRRVDISIDGQPFTSYIWPANLAKPVLYPLRTAKGTEVTRGFPLDPKPGERVDHPHHVGAWFNYGNVNGFDFWNNSEAIKPDKAPEMGNIRQRSIVAAKGGAEEGELVIEADWITGKQQPILKEHTRFLFRGGPKFRSVDRITTLTAKGEKVVFNDDKEGMLGVRVARALEMPSNQPEVFTDSSGRATKVAKLDNTGVNGRYLTSEGKEGNAVWSTRGRWCNLSGRIGDEPVTISIFDHPSNPGFPTFWHARGYGLFAANPLGAKIFTNGKEVMNFSIAPGQSVTFHYGILISSGIATAKETEAAYQRFVKSYP